MDIALNVGMLIVGLVLLIKGADFMVDGSISVAKKLKVSSMIIGLTVLAFGTSVPELVVSSFASFRGEDSIAFGNVIGSNIANLCIVLGLSAIILPLSVEKILIKKELPYLIFTSLVLAGLLFWKGGLWIAEGAILLVLFAFFVYLLIASRKDLKIKQEKEEQKENTWLIIIKILGGLGFLVLGGEWVVSGASGIALFLGLSPMLVGLTIVSVGTSLPEIVTSLVAAKKGHSDLAIGNVVGSNMFNVAMILGVASLINPLTFLSANAIDVIVMVVLTILVYLFAWKWEKITKKMGVVLVAIYVLYLAYIILRDFGYVSF